jgi:hypothetical protein
MTSITNARPASMDVIRRERSVERGGFDSTSTEVSEAERAEVIKGIIHRTG